MDTQYNLGVPHGYLYDPRTHTFLSPAGMAYPAPNPYRPPSPLSGPLSGPGTFQRSNSPGGMSGQAWNGMGSSGIHGLTPPHYPNLSRGLAHPSLPPRPAMSPHDSPLGMGPTACSPILETPNRPGPFGDHLSPHPAPFRSPSAPIDPRRDKRKASPDLSEVLQSGLEGRRAVSDLAGRARRSRGPPKAVLGGVGGKTFEEMQLAKATPKLSLEPVQPPSPERASPSNISPATKWKGSNVAIKLPPSHYSPPDTPPADRPRHEHPPLETEEMPKKSRKDAYPWPKHRKVLSGGSASSRKCVRSGTVRRSKAPIVTGEFAEASWRGKEVLVGLPSQDAWGSLFARAEEVKKRKEMSQEALEVNTEAAVEAQKESSDGPLTSPTRPHENEPLSTALTPEVISRGRLGNSAFLKRSLVGILRDGTVKDSSRAQRRAISDVFSTEDPPSAEPSEGSAIDGVMEEEGSAIPERMREGAPSPEFEEIPLSAANAEILDHDAGPMDNESTPRKTTELEVAATDNGLKSPLSQLGDLRTITPAKSRKFGPLVQQGFEEEAIASDDTSGAQDAARQEESDQPPTAAAQISNTIEGAVTSSTETTSSRPTKPLRADAGAFRPTSSRTMSTSSISSSVLGLTTLSTKLRPGATAFVPGHRSVSSMSVTSDTESTHSATAKALRASAAAFQPRGAVALRSSSISQADDGVFRASATSTPSPQKRAVSLRADAAAWETTSRTASMSSSTSRPPFTDTEGDHSFETSETATVSPIKQSAFTSPRRLHPRAQPFIPSARSLSLPAATALGAAQVPPSDREEREDTGKRAKLRPSATAFVPSRSATGTITRRQGLAAQANLAGKDDGPRLVPDSFEFAPTLRPTAAAFIPRFEAPNSAVEITTKAGTETQTQDTSTPHRARAETVAFGSVQDKSTPQGDECEDHESTGPDSPAALLHKLHGAAIDDQASSVGEVNESVDLSGLFYRPREDTTSTQYAEEPTVWRGEASPRDPVDGTWQEAVDARVFVTESRPNRMERSDSTRSNENSHLPIALASRPRSAVDFTVAEVAIHPSHPFNTPHISAKTNDIPNVPRSAHTQFVSGGLPSPEPVPPLPVFARAQNTPPVSLGTFIKLPLSALPGGISDPFAPSSPNRVVQDQSGESPASRYSQSSARTPAKYSQSPIKLSQTPHQRRRTSAASTAGNETFTTADGSPLIPSRSVIKPLLPLQSALRRSESPEPITKVDTTDTPSIKVEADNKRFREWIFPLHGPRPSISRRHTIPTELSPEIPDIGPGVASTSFAERVGNLRAATSGTRPLSSLSDPGHLDSDLLEEPTGGREREPSIEFPLRPGNRLLKVVNDVPSRASSMEQEMPRQGNQDEGLRTILERLERLVQSDAAGGVNGSDRLDALNAQLSASVEALQLQTSLLDEIRHQQKQAPEHDHRSQEMFLAILTGQHAMLDKLAELSDGKTETWQAIDSIRLANLQTYDQMAQNSAAQDQVATLTDELEALRKTIIQLKGAATDARSEAGIYKSRLDDTRKERDALREELSHKSKRLQSLEIKVKDQETENDKQLAMRLAAEMERDTLCKNLLDVRDEFDKAVGELESARDEFARVQDERDSLRAELRQENDEQDQARQSEMAQLRHITASLHESLLAKISGLEDGMTKAKEATSDERVHLVDENARLQEELQNLTQRLDASTESNTALQVSLSRTTAKAESEHESRRKQLATEQERRQASDERVETLERDLEQMRREMIDARTIATERQAYARMSEVRLQTLTQEAVYWRQFALEADRRKYRMYMASKPFHSSPPDAQIKTPAAGPGANEAEGHDSEPKTPTQNGGKAAHPLSRSVVALTEEQENGEEGQWWGLAA